MPEKKRAGAAGRRGGKVRVSLFLRADQLAALRARQASLGVPIAEQIRRAVDHELKGGKA